MDDATTSVILSGRKTTSITRRLRISLVPILTLLISCGGLFYTCAQQEPKVHLSLIDTGRVSLRVENTFAGDFFRVERTPALGNPTMWAVVVARTNLQTNFVFQRSTQSNAFFRIQLEALLPPSVLPPPTGLQANPVSASQIHVRWQSSSNATLYRV